MIRKTQTCTVYNSVFALVLMTAAASHVVSL